MPVILRIRGGPDALSGVLDGLVARNRRASAAGVVPSWEQAKGKVRVAKDVVWKDAPAAWVDREASEGSILAWQAASAKPTAAGTVAIGFIGSKPQIMVVSGVDDRSHASDARSQSFLMLTCDDDRARPVREIGDTIARHNAQRMLIHKLPPLYSSGVKYKPEGTPELWLDAEEIVAQGHDDCEGLAAYRAGELLNEGYDARVWTRLITRPSRAMGGSGGRPPGSRLFHAVTQVRDDQGKPIGYDDPSQRLGMPVPQFYRDYARQQRAAGKAL